MEEMDKGDRDTGNKDMQTRLKEMLGEGGVLARTIIEIVGIPKEHVEKTIILYTKKIKEHDQMLVVKEKKFKAKKQGNFFSAFAEMEIAFKSVPDLLNFCFDYMPASIEILEPETLHYETNDISTFVNDLLAKLHQLNFMVKKLSAENTLLNKNAGQLVNNFIMVLLRKEPATLVRLSQLTGIEPEKMDAFLKDLEKSKKIKKDNNTYSL
ncbi:hypothetical protein COY95_00880, partial [Candidatus Woesearchaeota archaeon CG_4_10_14_0_8_um_filter_47_5]